MTEVFATVVLPTFRRPASLARTLVSLGTQDDPGVAWDVVVVDNDGDGRAEAVVRAQPLPVPVAFHVERQRGSAHARNRAIAEATGHVIAFVDDDVVVTRDWLGRVLAPILAGRADGVGGRVVLDPAAPRPWWFDEPGLGEYLSAFAPVTEERELRDHEYVLTANAAFRSDILRRSGGFDARLGPRGRTPIVNDDVMLCRRFAAAGGRIHLVPDAVVVHELPAERLRPRYLLRRSYAQGRSDWIIDHDTLIEERFCGVGMALRILRAEMRERGREGLHRPEIALHAACDVARAAGGLVEAARLFNERRGR